MSCADALIHHDGERDHFFIILPAHIIGNRLAHADEHTCRAELVAVVEDGIRVDGGKVRDKKTRVERAQINDLTRQQAAAIHQLDKAEQKPWQDGDGEQEIREFIRIVVMRGHLILRDRLLDLAVDGENVIPVLEEHLDRRLVRAAVGARFQDDEADAEVVALIDLAVHDEAVDLRIFLIRLEVCRQNERHIRDADAFAALFLNVAAQDLHISVFGDEILRVVAPRHDIGQCRNDGGRLFHSGSVGTHGKFLFSLSSLHLTRFARVLQSFS